jgi:hypothetical protein
MTAPASDSDRIVTARKMARFFELHEVARHLALAGLKYDHPGASPEELRRLLRERLDYFRQGKWGQA